MHVWDFGYEAKGSKGHEAMDLIAGHARKCKLDLEGGWHTFYGFSPTAQEPTVTYMRTTRDTALFATCEALAIQAVSK